MKQRKKSLGIWIFSLLLFWGQWIVPVKASGPELRDVDMQMLGGQIRTITPMGLRMIGVYQEILSARIGEQWCSRRIWNGSAS